MNKFTIIAEENDAHEFVISVELNHENIFNCTAKNEQTATSIMEQIIDDYVESLEEIYPDNSKRKLDYTILSSKSLSEIIKKARKNKKISQKRLSELIGANQYYINNIERNFIKKPDILKLINIAEELDLDEIELFELAGYDEEEIEIAIRNCTKTEVDDDCIGCENYCPCCNVCEYLE